VVFVEAIVSALDLTLPSYMAPVKLTKMSMPPIGTIARW
jgi:hypothetical protein